MMKIALLLFAASFVQFIGESNGAINEINILPGDYKNDCADATVRRDQLRLFYKYRGLYDFRRYHYSDAAEDFKYRSGSVMFITYQEQVLHLKCPCKDEVHHWFQYGEGIEAMMFNKSWGGDGEKGDELNVKRPDPRSYYRTFACFTKGKKSHHYFNVFTRPAVKTDFPVAFQEDQRGDDMFWRCYVPSNSKRKCLQRPYTFGWVFPKKNDDSADEIRFLKDKVGSDKKSHIKFGAVMKAPDNTSMEIPCYKDKPWQTCKKPTVESYMKLSVDDADHVKQAGIYECVVTDRNGLSSSFRFENLDFANNSAKIKRIGEVKFGGFVNVHIRKLLYIIIPIVISIAILIFTSLSVWILPDNKEEYEDQLREAAARKRLEERRLTEEQQEISSDIPPADNDGIGDMAEGELEGTVGPPE